MKDYFFRVEIDDQEVNQILHELSEAQETIRRCYNRLQEVGVVVVRKETVSGN